MGVVEGGRDHAAGEGLESFPMLEKGDKGVEESKSESDQKPPESEHPSSTFFSNLRWPGIGHVVKTIILGMASNLFDVYSDVGSGLYHQQPKNVTRLFPANDTVPLHPCPLGLEEAGVGPGGEG